MYIICIHIYIYTNLCKLVYIYTYISIYIHIYISLFGGPATYPDTLGCFKVAIENPRGRLANKFASLTPPKSGFPMGTSRDRWVEPLDTVTQEEQQMANRARDASKSQRRRTITANLGQLGLPLQMIPRILETPQSNPLYRSILMVAAQEQEPGRST